MELDCSLTSMYEDNMDDEEKRERDNRGIKCNNFIYAYLIFVVY